MHIHCAKTTGSDATCSTSCIHSPWYKQSTPGFCRGLHSRFCLLDIGTYQYQTSQSRRRRHRISGRASISLLHPGSELCLHAARNRRQTIDLEPLQCLSGSPSGLHQGTSRHLPPANTLGYRREVRKVSWSIPIVCINVVTA